MLTMMGKDLKSAPKGWERIQICSQGMEKGPNLLPMMGEDPNLLPVMGKDSQPRGAGQESAAGSGCGSGVTLAQLHLPRVPAAGEGPDLPGKL